MRVLETQKDFHSNTIAHWLVSNIVLPTNEEKLNGMICSDLNQFVSTRYVLFYFVVALIILSIFKFLYEHVITARAKLGQRVLVMEGMLATWTN